MTILKKSLVFFVSSFATLYAAWVAIINVGLEEVPGYLYSEPLHLFVVFAFVTAVLGCFLPLRTRASQVIYGFLFTLVVAGVLSLLFGH